MMFYHPAYLYLQSWMIFCEFQITTSSSRSFSYSISASISYCFRSLAYKISIRCMASLRVVLNLLRYASRLRMESFLSEAMSLRRASNSLQRAARSRRLFSCLRCSLSFSLRYSFSTYKFYSFSRQISLSLSDSCAVRQYSMDLLLVSICSISCLRSSICCRWRTLSISAAERNFCSCSRLSLALRFSLSISLIFSCSWWLFIWYSINCSLCYSTSAWFSLSLAFNCPHYLVSRVYFSRQASSQRESWTMRFCQNVYSFIVIIKHQREGVFSGLI